MGFGGILRQSTAVDVLIGPFVSSTDGDTEMTGLTIAQAAVLLSKNGQTGAAKNDNTTCAHDADGFYNCELDATDTGTVGQLTLWVHVATALAVRHDYQVVEEAVYDISFAAAATGAVPVASIAANAITATAINNDAITAAKIAAGAIDAATFAADVDAEILSYLVDDATRIDASALNTLSGHDPGETIMGATDLGTGAGLTTLATQASVNDLPTNAELTTALADLPTNAELATALGTADDAVLAAIAALNNLSAAQVNTEVDTAISDAFTFSNGNVNANVEEINTVAITGDGQVGTEFGV